MARRRSKIKVDVVWRTSDDPNAILPWVRATEILLRAKARRDEYLARIEIENPTLYLIENLISFAHDQEDKILCTDRQIPFRVEVPLDMIRLNKGLLYTSESTGRTRTEPLEALTKVADRHLLTHSLNPADYSDITKNTAFTLTLLRKFLTESDQK